ncbi:6-bladed beta-propeller [Parabacteroides sp. OttesenSCG-928-J18]|nr:6-bladed beta-propeller [Parabacteroides sp. OttesenSCG-928-J18]
MKTPCAYPLFLFVILLALCGCNTKSASDDTGLLIVDVEKKYPSKRLSLQEIAHVEYIPLETSEDFLWTGTPDAFTSRYIINKNLTAGTIMLFDKKGKSLHSFNRQGNGAEEYSQYSSILYDEKNDEITVIDVRKSKLLFYDLQGNFKRSLNLPEGKYYNHLMSFDDKNYIAYNKEYDNKLPDTYQFISKETGEIVDEVVIPATGEKISEFVHVTRAANVIMFTFQTYPLIPTTTDFILHELSNDTIFSINSSKELRPLYVQTPSRTTMDPVLFLYPAANTRDHLFFYSVEKKYDPNTRKGFDQKYIMYEKKTKAFFEPEIYHADYVSEKAVNPFITTFSDGKSMTYVQVLNTIELIESYEKNDLKGELKEIASRLDEEDNPVLMVITYK